MPSGNAANTITLKCPRCPYTCDVCGGPATLLLEGPPANPAADPRYGGLNARRCELHTEWHYERYEVQPTIRFHRLATCDAEMVLSVDVTMYSGTVTTDDDIPEQCPRGHVFTVAEVSNLENQRDEGLQVFFESDKGQEAIHERSPVRRERD